MNKDEINVLDEVNKGACMGMDAIHFVLDKVDDEKLKDISMVTKLCAPALIITDKFQDGIIFRGDSYDYVTTPLDEKELNKTVLRLEKADGSEFLNKICDKEFLEVGCGFAPECVTGFGKLGGISVGFVSQNGAISCKGLDKATRFVELCEKLEIPLISVIDSDGAEISLRTETSPVLTRISKLIKALSDTCLPKISLIKGKASGIAYTVFASKQLGFENVIAWDSAEISAVPAVTGGVAIYADDIANAADPVKVREEAIEKFRFSDADPYNSAILGLVDNVIEPKYTRVYLIAALQTFADIG